MEIDITSFFETADPSDFSASIAETALTDIGERTWNAVKEYGASAPLLTTPEQLDALREHVKGFGAWEDEEIAAWDDAECNALFIQLVSGDIRAVERYTSGLDWKKHEKGAKAGHYSRNMYFGDDGKVYYHLGD